MFRPHDNPTSLGISTLLLITNFSSSPLHHTNSRSGFCCSGPSHCPPYNVNRYRTQAFPFSHIIPLRRPNMGFPVFLVLAVAGFGWAQMTPMLDCMPTTTPKPSCTVEYHQWGAPQIEPTTTYYVDYVTHTLNVRGLVSPMSNVLTYIDHRL